MENINYWRDKLISLRTELEAMENLSKDNSDTVELDQTKVGRLSRMDALQAQAMHNAVAARRHKTLEQIQAALTRIDDDEFGYCQKCGEEIPLNRLEVDPMTAVCVGCRGS